MDMLAPTGDLLHLLDIGFAFVWVIFLFKMFLNKLDVVDTTTIVDHNVAAFLTVLDALFFEEIGNRFFIENSFIYDHFSVRLQFLF